MASRWQRLLLSVACALVDVDMDIDVDVDMDVEGLKVVANS
jgi:hypothetical protein